MFGQLGLGDEKNRKYPTLIPNLDNIVQVLAGEDISLALSSDGLLYHFGRGSNSIYLSPEIVLDSDGYNIDSAIELYNTHNYKDDEGYLVDLDIEDLYELDKESYNYQIVRNHNVDYDVLVGGTYLYTFTLPR